MQTSSGIIMFWKMRIAKIFGNAITGYFCGLGTVSLTDSTLESKLLNAFAGALILIGVQMGRLLNEYGNKRDR